MLELGCLERLEKIINNWFVCILLFLRNRKGVGNRVIP